MVKRLWTFLLTMNFAFCCGLIAAQGAQVAQDADAAGEVLEVTEASAAPEIESRQSDASSSESGSQPRPNDPRQHEAAVLAIEPRITGTWLIDPRMGGGECKIRRSEIRTFDFELFDFSSHPDMTRKLFRFMDWNDQRQQFQVSVNYDDSFQGAVTYSMKLNNEGTELICEMSFDEKGKKSRELLKSQMTAEEYESLFQKKIWVRKGTGPRNLGESPELDANPVDTGDLKVTSQRSTRMGQDEEDFSPRGGMVGGDARRFPKNSIMTQNLLLIETQDGLSAFSTTAGTWSRITVGPRKDGQPRLKTAVVGNRFAVIVFDNKVLGFSGQAGRWGVFIVPGDVTTPAIPTVSETMAFVQVGNRTYALSPTTGEWTSSDGGVVVPTDSKVINDRLEVSDGSSTKSLQGGGDSQDAAKLKKALEEAESAASALAKQLRSLSSRDEPKDSPIANSLRQKFEVTLNRAFDLKCQLEQIQIHELQSRLTRLERQVGRRILNRQQIVNRRMDDLLDGQEIEWEAQKSKDSAALLHRSEFDRDPTNRLSAEDAEGPDRATVRALDTTNGSEQLMTRRSHDSEVRGLNFEDSVRGPGGVTAPDELASRVLRARADLAQAHTELILKPSGETSNAQLALAKELTQSARNRVAIAEDTFRSKVKEAAIRVEDAVASVKRERERLRVRTQLFNNAQTPYKDVQEAEALVQSAELALQTWKTQLELYERFNERLFERDVATSIKNWSNLGLPNWGMALVPISSTQEEMRASFSGFKYRGGLLVIHVRADSAAASSGICVGDVLVMVGPSEVSSLQDIKRLFLPRKDSEESSRQVSFLVIRNKNLITCMLPLPSSLRLEGSDDQVPLIKETE